MKSFKALTVLFIGLAFFLGGCHDKTVKVESIPNFLSRVDLTPGENDKEISVFLYLYLKEIDYNLTTKGDENLYIALNLKNTLKAEELNKLSVSGIEQLVENARVVQIIDDKNKENPLSTRITFKLKDPETKILPIIQVEPKQNRENYNNAMNKAKASSGFNNNMHEPENPLIALCSILFWILLIVGIVIIGTRSKKKRELLHAQKHLEDLKEINSDEI